MSKYEEKGEKDGHVVHSFILLLGLALLCLFNSLVAPGQKCTAGPLCSLLFPIVSALFMYSTLLLTLYTVILLYFFWGGC